MKLIKQAIETKILHFESASVASTTPPSCYIKISKQK